MRIFKREEKYRVSRALLDLQKSTIPFWNAGVRLVGMVRSDFLWDDARGCPRGDFLCREDTKNMNRSKIIHFSGAPTSAKISLKMLKI